MLSYHIYYYRLNTRPAIQRIIEWTTSSSTIVTTVIGIPMAINFQKSIFIPFAAAFSATIILHAEPSRVAFPAKVDEAARVYQNASV